MSDGKLDAIKCPNDLCTEDLLDEDVEFLAPPDVFNRYLLWRIRFVKQIELT
jgi:hypothetical protein